VLKVVSVIGHRADKVLIRRLSPPVDATENDSDRGAHS